MRYGDVGGPDRDQAQARRRRALRPAPHRARHHPGRGGGGVRRRGPLRRDRRRALRRLAAAGSRASPRATRRACASRRPRASPWAPTASARWWRWAPARRCSIAAPARARWSTATSKARGCRPSSSSRTARVRAAGFIPTNDGQVCVWAGAPERALPRRAALRARHGVRAHARRGGARKRWRRMKSARLVGRLHGFAGEVSYLRQPWGPGWALVGDASHFKDPDLGARHHRRAARRRAAARSRSTRR